MTSPDTTEPVGADGTWPIRPAGGPCRTWPLDPSCGCLPADPHTWDGDQQHAVEVATEILWRATAGRFGLCRETVRPCHHGAPDCDPPRHGWTGPRPVLYGGAWRNVTCSCRDRRSCGCGTEQLLTLPGPVYVAPPAYELEVWVDGHQLTDGWRLYHDNRLLRTDSRAWPDCQHLERPHTEPGTFAVIFWRGAPVPPGGRRAVAQLACELYKACHGDGEDCRIPPGQVQKIEREGVTYTYVDPSTFLTAGRTGITEIDLWLSAVNPGGHRSPPGVWSEDLPDMWSEHTSGGLP